MKSIDHPGTTPEQLAEARSMARHDEFCLAARLLALLAVAKRRPLICIERNDTLGLFPKDFHPNAAWWPAANLDYAEPDSVLGGPWPTTAVMILCELGFLGRAPGKMGCAEITRAGRRYLKAVGTDPKGTSNGNSGPSSDSLPNTKQGSES